MPVESTESQSLRKFWRSVGIVLTGTVAAQSIPLFGALVIARLYAPAEFGLFATWLGVVMMVAVVVTGRFEMTLAVESDGEPRRFAVVATLVTIALASLLLSFASVGAYLLIRSIHQMTPILFFLFVPATLLTGVFHTWLAWAVAEGDYKGLSWIRIAQSFVITAAQISIGIFFPNAAGMVIGYVLGLLAGIGVALYFLPLNPLNRVHATTLWRKLRVFWSHQRRFPLFALPADTINAACGQLPLLIIANRFGAEATGLFALTAKVLGTPIGLLGSAVLDVFKRSAASSYREKGHCKDEYRQAFWLLASGGFILAAGVIVVAEPLFVVAFGEPWRRAGTIAIWLMPMFALRFVASPLSYVFYIAGKQQIDLVWQSALLAMTLAVFFVPGNFEGAVKAYAAGYSFLYLIYAALSYRFSRGNSL
jgi:O-antigen/teichoic acid export membrane protein